MVSADTNFLLEGRADVDLGLGGELGLEELGLGCTSTGTSF